MKTERKRRLRLVPDAGADLLLVGDLAKNTGKTVRAIHLYEDLGLLEPQQRSKGHYRLFAPEAELRVRWISKMQSLGLSLTEIQKLCQSREAMATAMDAADALHSVYEEKLDEVRQKISELRALESELKASLDYLEACNTSCEDQLDTHSCASCSRHEVDGKPDLVAGAHVK